MCRLYVLVPTFVVHDRGSNSDLISYECIMYIQDLSSGAGGATFRFMGNLAWCISLLLPICQVFWKHIIMLPWNFLNVQFDTF